MTIEVDEKNYRMIQHTQCICIFYFSFGQLETTQRVIKSCKAYKCVFACLLKKSVYLLLKLINC